MTTAIQGIATVWLPVTDLQRSIEFYGRLGLEAKSTDDDWAELRSDSITIGLNARASESPGGDGGAVIAFSVEDDLEGTVASLKDEGVTFTGEISEHPWGRIATFADPDGNDLQLYQAPN